MTQVRHEVRVSIARERVFAYVNDYRTVPDWMFGVNKFNPLTEQTSGAGSTFDATMKLGPKSLHTTLKCTEWVENEQITLDAIDGFDVSMSWAFADAGADTLVTVEFDYTLPGGLAGRALGAVIEPAISGIIKHTEAELIRGVTDFDAA